MGKEYLHTKYQRGFSLLEIIVGATLIFLLAAAFTTAISYGEEGAVVAGQRARAMLVAEEGLEAARDIRDSAFTNLIDGTYGVGQVGGGWAFVGSSDTQDIFTRTVTISTVDANTKRLVSTVTWPINAVRNGTVTAITNMIDTSGLVPQAKSLSVDVSGGHVSSNNRLVGVKIRNIGGGTISVASTTISWVGGQATVVQEIDVNAKAAWSDVGPGYPQADQPSGATEGLDPQIVMSSKSQNPLNNIIFDKNIHGSVVTIKFIMSDNSSTTIATGTL